MKNIFLKIIPLLLLFSNLSYSQNFNFSELNLDQINQSLNSQDLTPSSIPAPALEKSNLEPLKDWTVMVYINGKNDLAHAGILDLKEMEKVGSTDKMNIVVELGYYRENTHRLLVKKENDPNKISSKILKILEDVDMGDWKHLVDFANWTKQNYPAKRYMLVIWNHGGGWTTTKGISYDHETNNHISTPELGHAMKQIGKVDILAMDACLMQMAEVAFEVKDYADIIVASQEVEPGLGYPYDRILSRMANMTDATNEEIAENIVFQYERSSFGGRREITQSAIKASKLDKLAFLLNDWALSAMQIKDKSKLRKALKMAETYYTKEYKDLYHFIELATIQTGDYDLLVKGEKITQFISDELVVANTSIRQNSHGISINLTRKGSSGRYEELAWTEATQWDEFLDYVDFGFFSFFKNGSDLVNFEETAIGNN